MRISFEVRKRALEIINQIETKYMRIGRIRDRNSSRTLTPGEIKFHVVENFKSQVFS